MCSARFYLDLVKSSSQNPKFISCYRIIKINFLTFNMEFLLIPFYISTLVWLVFLTAISLLAVIICDKKKLLIFLSVIWLWHLGLKNVTDKILPPPKKKPHNYLNSALIWIDWLFLLLISKIITSGAPI